MTQDLSYLNSQPDQEAEAAIEAAIVRECMNAIVCYLEEVAGTMDKQGIETLNVPTLRAMAQELRNKSAQ
jgi:hypothetical protein